MSYAQPTDLTERFGDKAMRLLSDITTPPAGMVNTDVLQRALDDASALIDGYLVGRYAVPLADAPAAMRVHCLGVARYLLMTANPDDRAKADFSAAMAWLGKVGSGQVSLLAPDSAPAPAGVGNVLFSPGQKVFGRENA